MTSEPCNRVDEALAALNVWGDAALLEHAKGCEECTSRLAVLKKKREFKDAFPTLSSIAEQGERAPVRATQKASEAQIAAARRRRVRLVILAIVATTGFVVRRWFSPEQSNLPPDAGESAAPRYRIYNLENALFESKTDGATVRSVITRGVAQFQVDPLKENQRFLLTLPDGDIEVRGTRFVVAVEDGKTSSVDVNNGSVVLRLQGRAEMVLTAGQRWPSDSSGHTTLSFMRPPTPKDAGHPD